MSKRRFVRDIELAKLQIKIASAQTWYYTVMGGFLAILFGLLIVSFSGTLSNVLGYVVNGFQVVIVFLMVLDRRSAKKDRVEFRKNFEDIYNRKRIKF